MEAYINVVLNRDDISELPYAMVCESRYGRAWNTSSRKKRWMQEFTERERRMASDIFRDAYDWYLKKGVPDGIEMSAKRLALWHKLADFCASL